MPFHFFEPASDFLNLSNDESSYVHINLAHQDEEETGDGSNALFDVNPQVTEALNDVTQIFSGLDDLHDMPETGPRFDETPQQVRRPHTLPMILVGIYQHPVLVDFYALLTYYLFTTHNPTMYF